MTVLQGASGISTQAWPETDAPIQVYTAGGLPFLGSVQEKNLPHVIPLHALPKARKQPILLSVDGPYRYCSLLQIITSTKFLCLIRRVFVCLKKALRYQT